MIDDPNRHRRRSLRLRGYDYSRSGWYFVTICTQDRRDLFGGVEGGVMVLNEAGRMAERWWYELARKFPGVEMDAFVVMPDHIHGIIAVAGADAVNAIGGGDVDAIVTINAGGYADPPLRNDVVDSDAIDVANVAAMQRTADDPNEPNAARADRPAHPGASLPAIVQWFKIMTTNEYIRGVKQSGWPPFRKRIWQRNYYEHIIRDGESLARIRRYIAENPRRWAGDRDRLDALLARMDVKGCRR